MTEKLDSEIEIIKPAPAITLEQLTAQVTRIAEFLDKKLEDKIQDVFTRGMNPIVAAEFLDKKLEDKIQDVFTRGMNPIVAALKQRFDGIEAKIGQNPQQQGQGNNIGNFLNKLLEGITSGGGSGGSSFGNEIEGMVREIVKLDLKDMLYTRRRSLPAAVQHVEVA